MSDIYDHMKAWGVPEAYRQDFPEQTLPYDYKNLIEDVSRAANWYEEQDRALIEMIYDGNAAAIREWAEAPELEAIGIETAYGDENNRAKMGKQYAKTVARAMVDLAEALEKEEANA